jgi:putative transcriptional regulator
MLPDCVRNLKTTTFSFFCLEHTQEKTQCSLCILFIVFLYPALNKKSRPYRALALTPVSSTNMSILKTGKAKALRLTTLDVLCRVLECEPGDILEYRAEG